MRCPRTYLAIDRPREKIFITGGFIKLSHLPLYQVLSMQLRPKEVERGIWIFLELSAFLARVVCKEREPVITVVLEQDDPRRRSSVVAAGRESHRIGVEHLGSNRVIHPRAKLVERVVCGCRFVELG